MTIPPSFPTPAPETERRALGRSGFRGAPDPCGSAKYYASLRVSDPQGGVSPELRSFTRAAANPAMN